MSPNPPCARVTAGAPFLGKQGFHYRPAISAETVGARAIHMQLLTIPPGVKAKAHRHVAHETAIYAIKGETVMDWGEKLEHRMHVKEGDFVYIPANMPHRPFNPSATQEAVAIIARTDPNEQESVELMPELEA